MGWDQAAPRRARDGRGSEIDVAAAVLRQAQDERAVIRPFDKLRMSGSADAAEAGVVPSTGSGQAFKENTLGALGTGVRIISAPSHRLRTGRL